MAHEPAATLPMRNNATVLHLGYDEPGAYAQLPLPPRLSRYHSLRGKSVSSIRDFNVFRDGDDGTTRDLQFPPPIPLRQRPRSASGLRRKPLPTPERPPPVPAQSNILSPKPINIAAQSGLKILEGWRSEKRPWKSLVAANRTSQAPTNQRVAPKDAHGASAGRPFQSQFHEPPDLAIVGSGSAPPDSASVDPAAAAASSSSASGIAGRNCIDVTRDGETAEQASDKVVAGAGATAGAAANLANLNHFQRRPVQASGDPSFVADEVARLEAETDRILAEQKKLDLARLRAQLVATPTKPKRPLLEKLSFFSLRARTASGSQPGTPTTPSTIVSAIFSPTFSYSSRDSRSIEEPRTPSVAASAMSFIEQGGKGIVPQTDAPVSAINGGERRVTVRCSTSTINLPVTADMSSVDVLTAASDMTDYPISPITSVITECYSALGLERRVRRYERVRDIMNSWDRDQQNTLLITHGQGPHSDRDLCLESVPRTEEPPPGFSLLMYHSSKPGRWTRRWVTLLDNGQIYAAKSSPSKPSGKDTTVLCHLTDFDIYTPRESEMRRNLNPPKTFCYAIKSQQKTVVFPNGENFVHFFSMEDAEQATQFYEKVHNWRSWYLVNRMMDLDNRNKAQQINLDLSENNGGSSATKAVSVSVNSNGNAQSSPTTSLAADANKEADEPLMNVEDFRMSKTFIFKEEALLAKDLFPAKSRTTGPRRSGTLRKQAPESSNTLDRKDTGEFSVGGLLGNKYDELVKQADTAPATAPSKPDGPFTEAPSLLNGGIPSSTSPKSSDKSAGTLGDAEDAKSEATSWFPSATEHTARVRSQSVHAQQQNQHLRRPPGTAGHPVPIRRERHPAPLLTFANGLPEPPRFRDGPTGIRAHAGSGQPLINFATGGPVRDAREGPPRYNLPRRGLPTGSPPQHPHPPNAARARSKSNATPAQRRFHPNDAQQLGSPMPSRRAHHPESSRQEPLVNRAR